MDKLTAISGFENLDQAELMNVQGGDGSVYLLVVDEFYLELEYSLS